MSLPLFEPTWSVSELCGEIREVLGEAFGSVWVAGEVQRLAESRRGHLYFELVEKGAGDEVCGKLDAVLWRTDHERVRRVLAAAGQRFAEGMEVRCRGNVDFYGAGGRLQLVLREVDPVFTLGLLERRRRETLAALAEAGLLDVNRALPFPNLPLRLALVTSHGSAAYHDFLATLRESGYAFRVTLVHAAVQGRTAERELVSALGLACRGDGPRAVDCAVVVRGGGARSDLAVFDSRSVAEAIARSPVPVVTGLGHEIDDAIADRVAHTAVKTPTKAAELLVERVARAERAAVELRLDLVRAAGNRLRAAREALGAAERGVELGRSRLAAAGARLAEIARALGRAGTAGLRVAAVRRRDLARRLGAAAPRLVGRRAGRPPALGERIAAAARGRLREGRARVEGLGRLATQLGPERTLARGFSITRDAAGALLRDPARVAAGQRITTHLAGGTLASRVVAMEEEG